MPQNIFLTGPPGVGKSTVVQRVIDGLRNAKPQQIHGFYTQEVRRSSGERAGFDIVTVSGERSTLATSQLVAGQVKVGRKVMCHESSAVLIPLHHT
jgi:nucleoside-triphosphatase